MLSFLLFNANGDPPGKQAPMKIAVNELSIVPCSQMMSL